MSVRNALFRLGTPLPFVYLSRRWHQSHEKMEQAFFLCLLKDWEWGYQATLKCIECIVSWSTNNFIPMADSYIILTSENLLGLLLLFFKVVESWVWHWKQSYLIPIAMIGSDSVVSNCTTGLTHCDLSIIISYWHLLAWGVSLPTD